MDGAHISRSNKQGASCCIRSQLIHPGAQIQSTGHLYAAIGVAVKWCALYTQMYVPCAPCLLVAWSVRDGGSGNRSTERRQLKYMRQTRASLLWCQMRACPPTAPGWHLLSRKQKQKQNKSPAILTKSLSPLLWQLRGPRLTDVPGFGSANHLIRGTQGMCFREPIESHRPI